MYTYTCYVSFRHISFNTTPPHYQCTHHAFPYISLTHPLYMIRTLNHPPLPPTHTHTHTSLLHLLNHHTLTHDTFQFLHVSFRHIHSYQSTHFISLFKYVMYPYTVVYNNSCTVLEYMYNTSFLYKE